MTFQKFKSSIVFQDAKNSFKEMFLLAGMAPLYAVYTSSGPLSSCVPDNSACEKNIYLQ